MTPDFVLALLQESLMATLTLAGPLLLVSMVVGLVVSVIQAATQIQEMTLVFVPKMLAVFVAMVFGGALMLDTIATFTLLIFEYIGQVGAS
jgi:flagellar biosynthetic protein FliQ